jgi:hypothetical protein
VARGQSAETYQVSDRDRARIAWIDSGRNPRDFEKELDRWLKSGAGVAQFITQFSDPSLRVS